MTGQCRQLSPTHGTKSPASPIGGVDQDQGTECPEGLTLWKLLNGEARMSYGTVAVLAVDALRDHGAVLIALALSEAESMHLDIHCLAPETTLPEAVFTGSVIPVIWSDHVIAMERAAQLEKQLQPLVAPDRRNVQFCGQQLRGRGFADNLRRILRFADWTVMTAPHHQSDDPALQTAMLEATLVAGRPPVIVVPEGCPEMPSTPNRLAVAWDGSREALAAIRGALPMLRRARLVDVVVVDPDMRHGDRSDPGGDLALFLLRHGAQVEINVLSRSRPKISDVLKCHVSNTGAEAMVMGALGHSRLREKLFGGTARDMLTDPPIPLILAR